MVFFDQIEVFVYVCYMCDSNIGFINYGDCVKSIKNRQQMLVDFVCYLVVEFIIVDNVLSFDYVGVVFVVRCGIIMDCFVFFFKRYGEYFCQVIGGRIGDIVRGVEKSNVVSLGDGGEKEMEIVYIFGW